MTLIALPIYVPSPEAVDHALERAAAGVKLGARLIEWRCDELALHEEALPAIARLVADAAAPSIVTIRGAQEGGRFTGDDRDRFALLRSLAGTESPPRYLDLELRAWLNHPHEQAALRSQLDGGANSGASSGTSSGDGHRATGLILSAHDFESRPRDLLQKIEAMTDEPACDVIKVAWRARSLRDNLEVFDLLRERRKPTIALAMGQFGLPSRILAPKFGGLLTFAADAPESETAPGQPALTELRDRYRFGSISRTTAVYGVVGWPVEHSRSPHLHNALFHASGHDGVYLPLPIPPEYEHFKATLGAWIDCESLHFRGASITIPHKEHLIRFVRERGGEIDPLAERIGAANTLLVEEGRLRAHNTDAPAIVEALGEGMGIAPAEFAGKRVAIFGAGGIARAATGALSHCGASIVIFNRSAERGRELAAAFDGSPADGGGADGGRAAGGRAARVVFGSPGVDDDGGFDIIINATSIGMTGGPAPDASPLPGTMPLDRSVTVLDTVYTPLRTPLIELAERAGARAITGDELFLRQAAQQCALWTGTAPTLEMVRETWSQHVPEN